MDRIQVDILGQWSSFFSVFLFDHLEDIDDLGLRLFRSSPPCMASWDGRDVGYKGAVIVRTKDHGIVVKAFHRRLFSLFRI